MPASSSRVCHAPVSIASAGLAASAAPAASAPLAPAAASRTPNWPPDAARQVALARGPVLDGVNWLSAGTMIRTETAEVPIEALRPGDRLSTFAGDGAVGQVKWIGRRRVDLRGHPAPDAVAPVRIAAGAFGDNMPARDLIVSPDHGIWLDGTLAPARHLTGCSAIGREFHRDQVDYCYIELTKHALLLANGLYAESYVDSAFLGFFLNAGKPGLAYPVPATDAGPAAARGDGAAGEAVPEPALLIDDRPVAPVRCGNGRHVFVVPPGAKEVRIASRQAGGPFWRVDCQRPGPCMPQIVFRGRDGVHVVPHDHPDLALCRPTPECDGPRRWADGFPSIPVPDMAGPLTLEFSAPQSSPL